MENMKMTDEKKMELFKKMLEYEHLAEKRTYDGINYNTMSNGMFSAFEILGIEHEYIAWAYGE